MKIMEENIQKDSIVIHDKILSELCVILKKFLGIIKIIKIQVSKCDLCTESKSQDTQDNFEERVKDIRYQNRTTTVYNTNRDKPMEYCQDQLFTYLIQKLYL